MRPLSLHEKELLDHPGPGEFYHPLSWEAEAHAFGKEKQRPFETWQLEWAKLPGPGEYSLPSTLDQDLTKAPTMGLGDKIQRATAAEKERIEMPSPGRYHRELSWGTGGQRFASEEQRPWSHEQIHMLEQPPPGLYYRPLNWEAPCTIFFTGDRKEIDWAAREIADVPGPGKYNLRPTNQ